MAPAPKPKQRPEPGFVAPADVRAVAGLDTASNRFHLWCNRRWSLTQGSAEGGWHSMHVCPDKMDPYDRRHELFKSAEATFGLLPTRTLLVIEEPLSLRSGKTNRLLSMAAGAIEAATYKWDLFVAYADVAAWKKVVIGNGNADKEAIKLWVQEHMSLDFDAEGAMGVDLYDAAALSAYGEIQLGLR